MIHPLATQPRKGLTQNEFLESQPEHLRDFYSAILDALPHNYQMSSAGIAYRSSSQQRAIPFCTPFRVKALLEASKSKHWFRVVELLNPKGELVECVIAEGLLTGRPREAIATLSNHGLQVHNEYQIRTILEMIRNWHVPREAHRTLVEKVGWLPDRDAFILTSGRVLTRKGAPSEYQYGGSQIGKEIGSLAQWRDHVAALAVGNANLLFGISLGLSTPLLEFTELDTSIYHFFGKTSKGKTRVLRTALTVWPKIGKKEKTWAGTINGLEAEIAKSHSILMGLDELRGDATPDLHAVIYRFANGTSKAKGKKEGGAQDREDWCTAVISNGEASFTDVLSKIGGMPTGGQGVRMLDIPTTGQYGVFDNLHGEETSDDFVDRLDRAIRKSWGAAGAAFVERLIALDMDILEDDLVGDMRRYEKALQEHLDVVPGDERTTEVRRVLRSFALVATAGEWASSWGLTRWEPGTAYAAVQTVAKRWLHGRGRLPFEQTEILKKMRDHLAENEQGFVELTASEDRLGHGAQGPGFRDETFFYLLPGAIAHLARKFGAKGNKEVLDALTEGGFLERGGEGKSLQCRLPSLVPGRPRAYRLRRTLLNFEEDTGSLDQPQEDKE